MDPSKDYYAILGITEDAEDVVIRAAYKALAQKYHPDKLKSKAGMNPNKMAEINEAYGVLSDNSQRLEYDQARGARKNRPNDANTQNKGANAYKDTQNWHENSNNNSATFHPQDPITSDVSNSALNDKIKGGSLAAFLLTPFWAIGNRVWIGLLSLIPLLGIAIKIYLGLKGKELAWKAKEWRDVEHFLSVQRKWNIAAALLLLPYIGFEVAVALPAYQKYVKNAKEQIASNQGNYTQPNGFIPPRQVPETIGPIPDPVIQENQPDVVVDAVDMPISRGVFFDDFGLSGTYHIRLYSDNYLQIRLKNNSRSYEAKRLDLINYSNASGFVRGANVKVTCKHIIISETKESPPIFSCSEPIIVGESTQPSKKQDNNPIETGSGYFEKEFEECMRYANNQHMANPREYCVCIFDNGAELFDDSHDWLAMKFMAMIQPDHKTLKHIRKKCGTLYFDVNPSKQLRPSPANDIESRDEVSAETQRAMTDHIAGPANEQTVSKLAELNYCSNAVIIEITPAAGYASSYDVNCPNKSILRVRCKLDGCFIADIVNSLAH